jgi:hypothetical protein
MIRPVSARRLLPAILLLFVGSGCAALIYEVVWFQLLELVIGSSAVSMGVLLGTFMGGMCLGSLVLPRLLPTDRHPLRVYAMLELGIGAIGLVVFDECHHLPGNTYRLAAEFCLAPFRLGLDLQAIHRRLPGIEERLRERSGFHRRFSPGTGDRGKCLFHQGHEYFPLGTRHVV